MRISDQVHNEKMQFAHNFWKSNPKATGEEVNAEVAKKFKHKLNSRVLYGLREELTKAASDTPIPQTPPAERKSTKATVTTTEQKEQNGIPKVIVDKVDEVLALMRKHRIESINIHSSGAANVRALKAEELDVNFGGRRAVDSPRSFN